MLYKELLRHLENVQRKKVPFAPIYYIYGVDAYLRLSALRQIEKVAVEEEFSSMNLANFTTDNTVQEIFDSLTQLPFFGDYRVVSVTLPYNADKKTDPGEKTESAKKFNNAFFDYLNRYVKEINPSTIFVIVSDEESVKAKYDEIIYVECAKLDVTSLNIEIGKLLEEEPTCQMDQDAINNLIERTLSDMTRISNEIPKLKAYTNGAKITIRDVKELVTEEAEYAVYEISNAVAAKNADQALTILNNMLEHGVKPMTILGILYNAYRKMFHVSLHPNDDSPEFLKAIGAASSNSLFYVKKSVKDYSQVRLKKCVDTIHEAQSRVLAGDIEESHILDEVIVKLLTI